MENYLKDIQDIKKMMDKSSQFISLSGLSGVLAGIYALAGASYMEYITHTRNMWAFIIGDDLLKRAFFVGLAVLILSITTGLFLSIRKAKKNDEKIWNSTSKRLLINFLIPIITGGIFSLLLVKISCYLLIPPVTLMFYGLACVNASKYTLRDVRYLGITIIIIGLLATYYINYGIEFWALGFGVCHILYGAIMYFKYDRKK